MASKKKGLSVEEKRKRMLDLFFEKKDFFQLKELEKIAPKEKGIVMQSVKEIVQSLVDDGLVDCEKIGTFVCFWAFPSKALNTHVLFDHQRVWKFWKFLQLCQRQTKISDLKKQLTQAKARTERLKGEIAEAKVGKEESAERTALLEEMGRLEAEKKKFLAELNRYKEFDPQVVAKIERDAETAKAAANRWTENVFNVKQWCKAKFQIDEATLNQQFNIPEELDFIE